jgi:hypothetical protein
MANREVIVAEDMPNWVVDLMNRLKYGLLPAEQKFFAKNLIRAYVFANFPIRIIKYRTKKVVSSAPLELIQIMNRINYSKITPVQMNEYKNKLINELSSRNWLN